ncbi:hypothetical protein LI328DRAFT_168136 [Trichoderma asperelloides]|nr:hypothetical protein LI328DRAFT_168136 [Trichoderma asperelloides]
MVSTVLLRPPSLIAARSRPIIQSKLPPRRVTSKTIGKRTITQTYRGSAPEPSQITTNKEDQFNFIYDPALSYALTSVTGADATDAYEYDPKSGIPRVLRSSYSTQELKHFPSGLLKTETISLNQGGTFSAMYKYSMGGKLQAYTDVNGQDHAAEYDSSGRMKQFTQGTLKVSFTYDGANRVLLGARHLENGDEKLLRDETFEYDENNRLVNYTCQGSLSPADEHGRQLESQHFTFDAYDNLVEVVTGFQDGSQNTATYSFSSRDPTQLTSVTNTDTGLPSLIELEYDANGCLTRDEQGRTLEYDSRSRLMAVRDAGGSIISQYHYDTAGRLVCQSVPGQADHHLFYRDNKLIAAQTGDQKVSYLFDGEEYWGQSVQDDDGTTQTQLWSSNGYDSVVAWIDVHQPDQVQHQQYTPYGSGTTGTSIGFNGEWHDPVTGWYHLGNGYRVYNPVLMRFHSPDSWSPFTSGEINPYAYCLGDPINRVDPSGHWGFFKSIGNWFKNNWKMVVGTLIAVAAGILAGVLTAGLSVAVQIGASISIGALVEAGWGAASNAIDGKSITWQSVLTDAVIGAAAGAFTEFGVIVAPIMSSATGSWPLGESLVPDPAEISSFRSGNSGLASTGPSTARDTVRPALENGGRNAQWGLPLTEPGSTSSLSSGGDYGVADVLNLELRCQFLPAGPSQYQQQNAGNSSLDILQQMRSTQILRHVYLSSPGADL